MALWLLARLRGSWPLLAVLLFALLMGLVMGLSAPKTADAEALERTRLMVGNYIQALPATYIDSWQESRQALLLNGGLLGAMALCGLHLLGLPLVVALLFAKGFSLGYAAGFLLDYQGVSGFAVIFLSMLPQNLLLLPIFIAAAYLAACFSLSLLSVRPLVASGLALYGLRFAALLVAVFVAALIQGYICPLLLKMFFVII